MAKSVIRRFVIPVEIVVEAEPGEDDEALELAVRAEVTQAVGGEGSARIRSFNVSRGFPRDFTEETIKIIRDALLLYSKDAPEILERFEKHVLLGMGIPEPIPKWTAVREEFEGAVNEFLSLMEEHQDSYGSLSLTARDEIFENAVAEVEENHDTLVMLPYVAQFVPDSWYEHTREWFRDELRNRWHAHIHLDRASPEEEPPTF